jgi:hypothetical protein
MEVKRMKSNREINGRATFTIRLAAAFVFALAVVLTGPISTSEATSSYKAILAKLPAEVRIQFLERLTFMNGGLAGAYIGGIETKLTRPDYLQLLAQIGGSTGRLGEDHVGYECSGAGECKESAKYICDPSHCAPVGGAGGGGAITMLGLLSGAPVSVRTEFLESLDFVNGRLVGATVGGISTYIKPAEFERLFARFGIPAGELRLRISGGRFRATGW